MTALLLAGLVLASPRLVRTARYNGPDSGDDKVSAVIAVPGGQVCLAGYSFGHETDFDFCLAAFGRAGAVAWVDRYGSPLGSEDRVWCAGLAPGGDVVAAGGSIAERRQGWDYLVGRYDASGDTAWLRRLDFAPHSDDKPAGLAVGPDGRIVVTGRSRNRVDSTQAGDWDIQTVMLTPGGDTAWTRRFDGAARGDDQAVAAATDDSGNCYVAGQTAVPPLGTDVVLLKYGPDGAPRWERRVSGDAPGSDNPSGVLAAGGRVYSWGALYNKGTSFDYFAACHAGDGTELWQRVLDGTGRPDICQAACLDPDGNLVVTGQSTGRSFDILTAKLSAEGETLWTRRFATAGEDRGWCVATDSAGNVFVGGTSTGPAGFPDMLLLGYGPDGTETWQHRYSGGGAGEARPVALVVDGDRLLVGGHAKFPGTGLDFVLLVFETGD